jgi:hypothetical protein
VRCAADGRPCAGELSQTRWTRTARQAILALFTGRVGTKSPAPAVTPTRKKATTGGGSRGPTTVTTSSATTTVATSSATTTVMTSSVCRGHRGGVVAAAAVVAAKKEAAAAENTATTGGDPHRGPRYRGGVVAAAAAAKEEEEGKGKEKEKEKEKKEAAAAAAENTAAIIGDPRRGPRRGDPGTTTNAHGMMLRRAHHLVPSLPRRSTSQRMIFRQRCMLVAARSHMQVSSHCCLQHRRATQTSWQR